MSQPFIIMCAPNGARKSKASHPALPISDNELADCAESILGEGASIIHLHVRDDYGVHTIDADRYRSAISAVRQRIGQQLVIQITTEACGIFNRQQQMEMVRSLRPEAVSLALRELCPDVDSEPAAAEFFAWLNENDVLTQYILYSADEVVRFEELRNRGVISDAVPFVLFVLGRYSDDLVGDVDELGAFVDAASPDTVWAVCSFGKTEHAAVAKAAAMGGHARVGFENNLVLPNGEIAADNAALVRLAADRGRGASRVPASADDVRQLFV
jgi:3-keto-5-aminohexanoate cleavage enzyme